ncbi:hypothetical protein NE237_008641 [Protea cynaroides]|uniref:PGG domain-containing protein n=1 Tax=Protea cynaroides TaxID=273540 RepID=A0A9Q0KW93_9MAGN|nr:hypothetical protein NE237_008641 [Protea cynaroides]
MEDQMETKVSSVKEETPISMASEEALQENNPISLEDVPVLTRENHMTWKDKMEKFLKKEGLWGYVGATIPERENFSRDRVSALKKLGNIFEEKSEAMAQKYIKDLDARLIWSQLVTMYEFSHPTNTAIVDGDLTTVSEILSKNKRAPTAILTSEGELPLHLAVEKRREDVAMELIKNMSVEDLSRRRKYRGRTALHIAASDGKIDIVKEILKKDEKLATIQSKTTNMSTPIMVAASANEEEVVEYLYPITISQLANPKEVYRRDERKRAMASFLNCLIYTDFYGLALDLLRKYPSLVLTRDANRRTTILEISRRPSAFPSSFPTKTSGNGMLGSIFQNCMYSLPGCMNIYSEKLKHYESSELLKEMWKLVPNPDLDNLDDLHNLDLDPALPKKEKKGHHDSKLVEDAVVEGLFVAIENGIVEFIEETIKNWPQLLLHYSVFHHVISNRQEKIFDLIHHLGALKFDIVRTMDGGNLLSHQVAIKAPIHRLNLVTGAVLQMQRELLWYKEVDSIMSTFTNHNSIGNQEGKTPKLLFTEQHKELAKEGATWLKDTATQCMVVAALITTIMFAAVFTVPGSKGSDYVHGKFPIIFMISNILALCSSVASMLLFLAIITSRYAEEDFLSSLPRKLRIGLLFLFISIVGMMIAFVAAIFVMLPSQLLWVSSPIILLAAIPIILYASVELPLYFQLIFATSSVFGKGKFSDVSGKGKKIRFAEEFMFGGGGKGSLSESMEYQIKAYRRKQKEDFRIKQNGRNEVREKEHAQGGRDTLRILLFLSANSRHRPLSILQPNSTLPSNPSARVNSQRFTTVRSSPEKNHSSDEFRKQVMRSRNKKKQNICQPGLRRGVRTLLGGIFK